jgi:hypothetical protein
MKAKTITPDHPDFAQASSLRDKYAGVLKTALTEASEQSMVHYSAFAEALSEVFALALAPTPPETASEILKTVEGLYKSRREDYLAWEEKLAQEDEEAA